MKHEEYFVGYTGCYIQDHPFEHFCVIPFSSAVEWVKVRCPNVQMGGSGVLAKELITGGGEDIDPLINGWLNKLFIIIGNDHDRWIALVNWDGHFSMYIERKEQG